MNLYEKLLVISAIALVFIALLKSGMFGIDFFELIYGPNTPRIEDISIVNPIVDKEVNKTIKINYNIYFPWHGNEVTYYDSVTFRTIHPSGYTAILIDGNLTKIHKLYDYVACIYSDQRYTGCRYRYAVDVDISNLSKGIHNLTVYVFLIDRGYWINPRYCGSQRVVGIPPPTNWDKYGGTPTSRCQSLYDYLGKMRWDRMVEDLERGNYTKLEAFRVERFKLKIVVCERGECIEPRIIEKIVEKEVVVEKPYIPKYIQIAIAILLVISVWLAFELFERRR